MPREELQRDQRLLLTMSESANDAHYIVRRTLELIEQSQIILRELDVHGTDGGRISPGHAAPLDAEVSAKSAGLPLSRNRRWPSLTLQVRRGRNMLPNPLVTLQGEAVQRANEHRLKVLRLRNMRTILEKNYDILMKSLTLIVQADHLLARDDAALRGGHANITVLPMLQEIREWLQVAKREAIECGKMANSSATGLHKEWLYKELLDIQRQWLSILLSLDLNLVSLLSIN